MSKGVDLVTLRMFLSTAEEGSVGRAAERENIALSAISRRISDLEARTGLILFDRRDRGMSLTATGRVMVDHVRDVFERLDVLAREIDVLRSGDMGYLRLFHQSAATELLPPILASFLHDHSNIQLEIDEAAPGEIIRSVRSGEADVGIVTSRTAAGAPDLDQVSWVKNQLVAVLPTGHPLAENADVSIQELVRYPVITLRYADAVHRLFSEAARSQSIRLLERVRAVSYESVRHMVSAGLGVAIMPTTALTGAGEGDQIEVRPLRDEWAQRILIICSRSADVRSAAATLLIEHIAQSQSPDSTLAQ